MYVFQFEAFSLFHVLPKFRLYVKPVVRAARVCCFLFHGPISSTSDVVLPRKDDRRTYLISF